MDHALIRFRQAADRENRHRPLRRRYSPELQQEAWSTGASGEAWTRCGQLRRRWELEFGDWKLRRVRAVLRICTRQVFRTSATVFT